MAASVAEKVKVIAMGALGFQVVPIKGEGQSKVQLHDDAEQLIEEAGGIKPEGSRYYLIPNTPEGQELAKSLPEMTFTVEAKGGTAAAFKKDYDAESDVVKQGAMLGAQVRRAISAISKVKAVNGNLDTILATLQK